MWTLQVTQVSSLTMIGKQADFGVAGRVFPEVTWSDEARTFREEDVGEFYHTRSSDFCQSQLQLKVRRCKTTYRVLGRP